MNAAKSLDELRVADAMHPGVLTCPLETSLRDVARMMTAYRIHAVVTLGDPEEEGLEGNLWGIVSDLDLVGAAVAGDFEDRTAGGTAASPVVMVAPEDSLGHAATLMTEHEVAHVVVVDPRSGRPVGVVSTLDVARALAPAADRQHA